RRLRIANDGADPGTDEVLRRLVGGEVDRQVGKAAEEVEAAHRPAFLVDAPAFFGRDLERLLRIDGEVDARAVLPGAAAQAGVVGFDRLHRLGIERRVV